MVWREEVSKVSHETLKAMIEHADLRDDFMRLGETAHSSVPSCGICCAPGCVIMRVNVN